MISASRSLLYCTKQSKNENIYRRVLRSGVNPCTVFHHVIAVTLRSLLILESQIANSNIMIRRKSMYSRISSWVFNCP